MPAPFTLCLQATPDAAAGWAELAGRAERAGFAALYVADHPGSGVAPFVALAAAATVTERIALGSYVANAGMWEPLLLANEVATLDLLSDGRAVLGLGAGHTPAEWTMQGRDHPSAGARVDRMIEVAEVTRRLLAGETVTFTGKQLRLDEARLVSPRPVADEVPLLVGGNGTRVLYYAAQRADIVGLSGLGRTLADGHRHAVDWSPERIDERIGLVHDVASTAGRAPALDALVQWLELTEDADAAAARLAERLGGVSADDLLAAPFVLIGTADELADELHRHHRRYGITRFTVRATALDAAEVVLSALDRRT